MPSLYDFLSVLTWVRFEAHLAIRRVSRRPNDLMVCNRSDASTWRLMLSGSFAQFHAGAVLGWSAQCCACRLAIALVAGSYRDAHPINSCIQLHQAPPDQVRDCACNMWGWTVSLQVCMPCSALKWAYLHRLHGLHRAHRLHMMHANKLFWVGQSRACVVCICCGYKTLEVHLLSKQTFVFDVSCAGLIGASYVQVSLVNYIHLLPSPHLRSVSLVLLPGYKTWFRLPHISMLWG